MDECDMSMNSFDIVFEADNEYNVLMEVFSLNWHDMFVLVITRAKKVFFNLTETLLTSQNCLWQELSDELFCVIL